MPIIPFWLAFWVLHLNCQDAGITANSVVDSLSSFTELLASNAGLAYGAVLALAFLEAVPVIGSVIPGSVLIIAIAALVPTGTLKMWPLMIAAIVGATLGDGLPFLLGHRYRESLQRRWPLNQYPGLVDKSRRFIERHGGRSIFLARFTPGVRGFVPVVAGVAGMPASRFYVANVLSALAWAPAHIVPGVLLGASLARAGAAAGRLVVLLMLVGITLWLAIWAVRLALRFGVPLAAAAEARMRAWASSHDTWLFRQVQTLVDPERSEGRALLLWAAVVIGAAWLFFGILEDVVAGDPLVRVDATIYRALQALRTPASDAVMIAITELGDTIVTTSVTVVVLSWLAWQRAWHTAAYWAAAVGFAATLNAVTKFAIHRARPGDLAYVGTSAFSFPSGHATVNAVMYGFLAFLLTHQLPLALRFPVFAAAAFFATLMAFSRLYLGAHWFSDVVGSLAFATAWIIVLALAYARHHEKPFDKRGLAIVACAGFMFIGGFNIYHKHVADTHRYAVRHKVPTIAAPDWWTTAWQQLPAYRIDLTGETEEPLTLQWAGTIESLKSRLLLAGWHSPEPWTFANALAWLVTSDPQQLPVIPALEAGQIPSLTLIKSEAGDANSRIVFRAWPANIELGNGGAQPIWGGSVVTEKLSRPLSFVTFARTTPNVSQGRERLLEALPGGRLVKRGIPPSEDQWDGLVLLACERPFSNVPTHTQQVEK